MTTVSSGQTGGALHHPAKPTPTTFVLSGDLVRQDGGGHHRLPRRRGSLRPRATSIRFRSPRQQMPNFRLRCDARGQKGTRWTHR
jgi:hypothetical protein